MRYFAFLYTVFFLLKPMAMADLCIQDFWKEAETESIVELLEDQIRKMEMITERFGLNNPYRICNEENGDTIFHIALRARADSSLIDLLINFRFYPLLHVENTFRETPLDLMEEQSEFYSDILNRKPNLKLSSLSISPPSSDRTPEITISGVTQGQILRVYRNNDCTNFITTRIVVEPHQTSITIEVPQLPSMTDSYNYYVTVRDPISGNESACSANKITYELVLW